MPKVSVIIPTYNRAEYICETIDSVLAQTYKDYEIIVVDDGSTDNTKEVLGRYMDRIRYFYKENEGIPQTRNYAIAQSKGEYLAFIDADDCWLPEKLEKQLKVLEDDPALAFVSSATHVINDKGQRYAVWRKGDKLDVTYKDLYEVNFVLTLTVVLRKSCFLETEGFDTGLECSQDYDMWLQIARRHPFAYMDECLAIYRNHPGGISRDIDLALKNRISILKKPELSSQLSVWGLRKRLAREYCVLAGQYEETGNYLKMAQMFLLAVLQYPFVGSFYWPQEAKNRKFTWPYRVLRIYYLGVACLIKGLAKV